MLVIRAAQLAALSEDTYRRWLASQIRTSFPQRSEQYGDDELRALVDDGLGRAEAHGLTSNAARGHFVFGMVLLGAAFDRDPALPFVASILGNGRDGDARGEALFEAVLAELWRRDAGKAG